MHWSKSVKKKLFVRTNVFLFILLLFVSAVIIHIICQQDELTADPFMHIEDVQFGSCHYSEEGDALPSAEDVDFSPRPNSIFFHETSCRGGLTSRQACAIESTARAHPRRQIYVLFSAPVTKVVLTKSNLAKLRAFPNVRVARVHLEAYAKKTPLEEMVASKPFSESQWWIEHTSEILRSLTLYKWGGVYLDTDMIVVKSLTPLGHNWIGKEDNNLVNTAAMAISMDHLGRRLAGALVNELKSTYRSDLWTHNGPEAITRVLAKLCNSQNNTEWSSGTCNGLEIFGPEYFYPVHHSLCDIYFESGDIEELTQNAYIHHIWNRLTNDVAIQKDSPYMKLAEKYCPMTFQLYGDRFGS